MKIITLHGTGYFDKIKYLQKHSEIYPIDWENIFKKKKHPTKGVGLIVAKSNSKGKMRADLLIKLRKTKMFHTVYLVSEEKTNLKWHGQSFIDFPKSYDESEKDYLKTK